jgi:hypothetical protein
VAEQVSTISEPHLAASDTSDPVERAVRAHMQPGPTAGFAEIRVHTDDSAATAARALNARAFTAGNDIYFDRGEYSPSTGAGRRLLAHEFAHVFQQQGPGPAQTLMRQPKPSAGLDELSEIMALRNRRVELIQREAKEGRSTPELWDVEQRLAYLERAAAEPDPTRKKIIRLRGQLRQRRDQAQRTPPSSAREQIGLQIQDDERELAQALRARNAAIERELGGRHETANLSPAQLAAETELLDNEAELKVLSRIFTPQKAATVGETYKKEVRHDMSGHCMGAVYKGMEAIYSPKASADIKAQVIADSAKILKETKRDTNDVDRIMETLRQHSMAGEKQVIKFSQRRNAWEPPVEKTVLNMVSPDYPGWYFFGLSVSGGWHSVILAVDNTIGMPSIYWMDQYSKGFTDDVTGKVDRKMHEHWLEPYYGFTDSAVWPLLPTAGAVVEVK